jgi:hypothetical protein
MRTQPWRLAAAAVSAGLLFTGAALAEKDPPAKAPATFGALRALSPEEARGQALDWLKAVGKADEASLKAFNDVWGQEDRPLLDKVAATLALGDEQARQLLAEASDPAAPAPQTLPAALKDGKQGQFYRSNLALAYGKALAGRRVHEEALEALKAARAEQVIDPAVYLFTRAVVEHALTLKKEAGETIIRLLDDVADTPECYKTVAALMYFDMQGWQTKDLGDIARKMDNIERRLDLTRGGPQTQKMQKDVLARLDELIKELENQCNCNCNGGNCPNGGNRPSNNIRASSPQKDSVGGNGAGPGNVDPKRFKEIADVWGKLPEKERVKILNDLKQNMPAQYDEIVKRYFKKLNQDESDRK